MTTSKISQNIKIKKLIKIMMAKGSLNLKVQG